MAMANGAIYQIVVAQALRPFPQATGRAAALQNTLQLGLCFVASLVVSGFIAHPLLATTSVMLSTVVLVAFGYRMQRQECENIMQMRSVNRLRMRSFTSDYVTV